MRLLLIVAVMMMAACNYNKVKSGGKDSREFSAEEFETPDYAVINAAVIGPKCVSCHSNAGGNKGGVNLETYSAVRSELNRVAYEALEAKTMPEAGPLSDGLQKLLAAWIDSGAPERVVGIGEKPDKSIEKGPNDWKKMSEKLFQPKCVACHMDRTQLGPDQKPDGDLDLTNLKEVRDKAKSIFDAVIIQGSMPPEGVTAVTPPERRVLLKWFDSGMPE